MYLCMCCALDNVHAPVRKCVFNVRRHTFIVRKCMFNVRHNTILMSSLFLSYYSLYDKECLAHKNSAAQE